MGAQRIAVVTDSTAYLPPEVLERLNISVIPLNIVWGQEVLKDGIDIMPSAFYERLTQEKNMPTTSQPSAGEFVDFVRQAAEKANTDTVVGVFISSGLSGTVASAEMSKSLMSDVRFEVVDSYSTSMGLGLQAMAAAELAQAGGSLEEVLETANNLRYKMNVLFVVDTLEFLHRGGRIGGAKRFVGTALKIKPILVLEDGKIEALDQVRTKKKALRRLMNIALECKGNGTVPRASMLHANAAEEGWLLQEEIQSVLEPKEMYAAEVSPVIGTHVGPGTLGMAFYTE